MMSTGIAEGKLERMSDSLIPTVARHCLPISGEYQIQPRMNFTRAATITDHQLIGKDSMLPLRFVESRRPRQIAGSRRVVAMDFTRVRRRAPWTGSVRQTRGSQ